MPKSFSRGYRRQSVDRFQHFCSNDNGRNRRNGTGHRHWLEHSHCRRGRAKSSGHLSPVDLEKLGVRNSTDLLTNLAAADGHDRQPEHYVAGGDGTVLPNLRGLLPKETLVLIDGKRVAIDDLAAARCDGVGPAGVDINLIPFPMIDHIDILKDGASAVYGADAVAGVINIFLLHKFRGLEIGGSYGNTNLGASNDGVSWRVGSRRGREMTKPISSLLPIFTIVPPFTVATATLPAMRSWFRGGRLIFAVRVNLAVKEVFA